MAGTVKITVLVENVVRGRGLQAEHGLAWWIEVGERRILFDTGQGMVLEHNAAALGIDLGAVDTVVLSHGHYDHVGGLEAVLRRAPGVPVIHHPTARESKYRVSEGGIIPVGHRFWESHDFSAGQLRPAAEPTQLFDRVTVTGTIPRVTDFEVDAEGFVLDAAGEKPDPLWDDQALFFDTQPGLVVVLGCAHAGVINTLRRIRELGGGRPIHTVMGGMHLLHASGEQIVRTIEALREMDVQRLGPCHCTGDDAIFALRQAFPDRFFTCRVGTTLPFGEAMTG